MGLKLWKHINIMAFRSKRDAGMETDTIDIKTNTEQGHTHTGTGHTHRDEHHLKAKTDG